MLCLGDDSGPNLHSWQLVHPHVGYCTGAVQSACCVRSAIDTMKLYWIKGLSASTNYSKEHIGFYKTPKLAFIGSTLIHFSSSSILLLPYNQCLLELRSWQGDVHASCNIVVPAECCYHGMHTHGVAEHKKQGVGRVMGLTWHHGQQQRSPPPSGPLGWHREDHESSSCRQCLQRKVLHRNLSHCGACWSCTCKSWKVQR